MSAEEFDVEFESFLEGPISPKGYKMDVNVRDEAQDKDIHTSTWTHADNAELLLENLEDLRFAEDFPELLKQQIQDTFAKIKAMGLPSGMPAEFSIARRTFLFTDVNSYIYCTLQNRIFRIPAFYRMHLEVLCWGMYEL